MARTRAKRMDNGVARIPGPDYVKSLDGVRGLAILMVVIHNASWIQSNPTPSFLVKLTIAATSTGWVGVSLFFVLSGVLITGILLSTRGSPGYLQSFLIRRALRSSHCITRFWRWHSGSDRASSTARSGKPA
jgi:peptidoglycan/LPS O-acetylase OafA/YrhL